MAPAHRGRDWAPVRTGGHDIVLGSRDETRASEAAGLLNGRLTAPTSGLVTGAVNEKAADVADVVVLTVPYQGHDELARGLRPHLTGKLVISCVNPLGFDKQGPFGLDLGPTSAAEQAQELLPESRVVGAFHHLSAVLLIGETNQLEHEDVLVCGNDREAKQVVMDLAATVTGHAGIDAGALRLARQLEPLTAVLISINTRYKVRAGVAIAGVPRAPRHVAGRWYER